jgi:hypothetical protein
MLNRRETLITLGTTGMLGISGCLGGEYPTGEATVEYDRNTVAPGPQSRRVRRIHFIDIQAPEETWGQIHIDLSKNAEVTLALIAESGGGTVYWMPRGEWKNYLSPETGWEGLSLRAYEDEDSESAGTLFGNTRFSIAVENYESGDIFEAELGVGEFLDPSFSFRESVVADRPELPDELMV